MAMPRFGNAPFAPLILVVALAPHDGAPRVFADTRDSAVPTQLLHAQHQAERDSATRVAGDTLPSQGEGILLAAVAAAALGAGAAYYVIKSCRARRRDDKVTRRTGPAPLPELPELITIHDAAGKIRFASRALRKLSGYTTVQLLGRRGRDFVHEDDVAAVLNAVQGNASPSTPTRLRMRTRTGDYVWLEARFEHISSAEGEPQLICRARCIATSSASALELLERELTSAPPAILAADLPTDSLADALRESLKHREFDLRYQPKVALTTWQVTGVEALLR